MIDRVLQECRSILIKPHVDSPSNAETGQQYVHERENFNRKAWKMTNQYDYKKSIWLSQVL